jgi:hypothetical protein
MSPRASEPLGPRLPPPPGPRPAPAEYESRVASLAVIDLSGCPLGLEQVLRQMLSASAPARPPVIAFSGCQYFQVEGKLGGPRALL